MTNSVIARLGRPAVSVVLLTIVAASPCQAQEEMEAESLQPMLAAAASAVELLNVAPTGETTNREVQTVSGFLDAASHVLESRGQPPVASVPDAVERLELLAEFLGPVEAVVEAEPPGSEVFYRRVYQDREGSHPIVTTNDTVFLRVAGEYFFWTLSAGGDTIEQRKDCRYPCRVVFNLEEDPKPIPSAEARKIRFGETRLGSLSSVDAGSDGRFVQSWRLVSDRDQRAYVELASSDFDALLMIIDPRGSSIQDDDSGCGYDARLSIDLETSVNYRVFVTSYDGSGQGAFALRVNASSSLEEC